MSTNKVVCIHLQFNFRSNFFIQILITVSKKIFQYIFCTLCENKKKLLNWALKQQIQHMRPSLDLSISNWPWNYHRYWSIWISNFSSRIERKWNASGRHELSVLSVVEEKKFIDPTVDFMYRELYKTQPILTKSWFQLIEI